MDQEGIPVFTHSHRPATATSRGRRLAAGLTSVALATGFALAGATTARAADSTPVATSEAQFLSGSLLGVNLDNVVALAPASAHAGANDPRMTQSDPLKVTALNAVTVGDGSSIQTSAGGGVQAGAVGQYATAAPDGTSMAWTGAAGPDGGVGIGQDQGGQGGDATVDLSKLLGAGFASNLTNLQLAVNAVAAQAVSDGKSASGDYSLDGVTLNLTSPAIANLTDKVNTALDSVKSRLAVLGGSDGELVTDVNKLLTGLNPALNLLGANADVTATVDTGDLSKLVQDLLQAQYGDSGITFNLETGVVTLDLGKLLGEDLNNLAPGTELIDPAVIDPALASVTTKVSDIADQVVNRVKDALNNAKVNIHANLSQDTAQAPIVENVCTTVKKVIQVPVQVPISQAPIVGGVLGNVLGDVNQTTQTVTQLVDQTVDQLVCSDVATPLPALNTSAVVDITGTVGEFLNGSGVDATAALKVLGIPLPPVDLGTATSAISDSLTNQLLGSDGAITDLTNALNLGLVAPAVQGLTGGPGSVDTALTGLLSATVNNQDVNNGTFTETALRVTALPGISGITGGAGVGSLGLARAAGSGAAQVNFARASVGPNVVPGDVGGVDTTPPPTDGNPGNPGTTAGNIARLATTGVGIAALVAAVLALLAAGAYLVRESYRRNHSAMAV
jgi:hypothetical protein